MAWKGPHIESRTATQKRARVRVEKEKAWERRARLRAEGLCGRCQGKLDRLGALCTDCVDRAKGAQAAQRGTTTSRQAIKEMERALGMPVRGVGAPHLK
jgi:predicted amidophosphoribosyltransferase